MYVGIRKKLEYVGASDYYFGDEFFFAVEQWKSWAEAVQPGASMSTYSGSVMCIGINISNLGFC